MPVMVTAAGAALLTVARIYGSPDLGPIFSGYLGILLVGALCIAIGLARLAALIVNGFTRFVSSGLSAALPHVVPREEAEREPGAARQRLRVRAAELQREVAALGDSVGERVGRELKATLRDIELLAASVGAHELSAFCAEERQTRAAAYLQGVLVERPRSHWGRPESA